MFSPIAGPEVKCNNSGHRCHIARLSVNAYYFCSKPDMHNTAYGKK